MRSLIYLMGGIILGVCTQRYILPQTDNSQTSVGNHGDDRGEQNAPCRQDDNPPTDFPDPNLRDEGSSVWCKGSNHTDRTCKFQNLCYSPGEDDFIFFHGPQSVLNGIPGNLEPALLDMTSVRDHNSLYFTYVDLEAAHLDYFDNVDFYHGDNVIFNRFNPDNLMHVLHDDLLPLFTTLSQITSSDEHLFNLDTRIILMEGWKPGEYKDLYQLFSDVPVVLKSNLKSTESPGNNLICFRNAFLGLSKSTVWYDYGFTKPQGRVANVKTTATEIRQFTKFVEKRLGIVSDDSRAEEFIVILSRKINRLLLNEGELMFALIQQFGLKVMSLSVETHAIREQIELVSKASVLIGVHGSLMSLSMFLRESAVVIEIFPYAVNPEKYTPYKTMATITGMNLVYRAWRNTKVENTVTHPENPPHLGGIQHLSDDEQEVITQSKDVPVHQCCSDPQWLYRIYQDTVVDIGEFIETLKSAFSERTLESGNTSVNLYPSKVKNVTCNLTRTPEDYSNLPSEEIWDNPALALSWIPPWNVKYLTYDSIKYEVWIQESGRSDYSAWVVSVTEYKFTKHIKQDTSYNAWVRCILNDTIVGPFAGAVVCS
ncbi:protein O-linked-mannose beta-1,4-N-acetylglucosaminyltransferase 2-like [Saccoglossus kowalevskii]|uniref:Protein O-linked-mannose beta-1,4-N-acetylglucosaminyltransferase 2-like n=1 Tax=Saccoglossus kowalevskii TaxID=10224 RepID=A0ABM0MA81_SACKO|nr:PREDICTED: protein O-linked-mannose beta-1,4-N-acetylglucosaminyltransferase 2-like [Saccoglossus kowalevskii]